jgi:cell envelope opacity-associated protein A
VECWSDNKAVIALAFVEMVRRRTSARKKRTAYAALGAAPAKHGGGWVILVLGALVLVNLYVFVWDGHTGVRALKEQAEAKSAPSLTIPAAPLAPVAAVVSQAVAQPALARGAGSAGRAGEPAHPSVSVPPALATSAPTAAANAAPASAAPTTPSGARTIEGKVGKSDTLGRLLKHNGLTAAETDEIIRALSGALDFRTIRAGQSFRIERGSDGHVTRFDLDLGKGRHVRAERQPAGTLKASVDTT